MSTNPRKLPCVGLTVLPALACGSRASLVLVAAWVLLSPGCRGRALGGASPSVSASASAAVGASAAAPSSAKPIPVSPGFTLVADQNWSEAPQTLDFGEGTFLLTGNRPRVLSPGQTLQEALDVTSGLPPIHPVSGLVAGGGGEAPLVIGIRALPMSTGIDNLWFRLEGKGWLPLPLERCVDRAFRLGSDTVAIGLVDAPEGDPSGVPAGNRTRAWLVREKGTTVVPWSDWPNAMTWQEQTSGHVLWATATRPGVPGKWLLRIAAGGRPKFFAIPERQACRGSDRYFDYGETLSSVGDETAVVTVQSVEEIACLKKGAGRYQLTAKTETWERLRDDVPNPKHSGISADGTTFHVEGAAVVVESRGKSHSCPLREVEQFRSGEHPAPLLGVELRLTAGNREVWALAQIAGRSLLYRYEGAR
jgi:hypothetical protein